MSAGFTGLISVNYQKSGSYRSGSCIRTGLLDSGAKKGRDTVKFVCVRTCVCCELPIVLRFGIKSSQGTIFTYMT